MKCFKSILFLMLAWQSIQAQTDSSFKLVRTIKGDIADARMDNLENLYLITPGGQIKKFGPAGDSVGVYNQVRRLGQLNDIDVSNPLRPLLFYKDFSTVVVLDRFLANRAVLDLRIFNILQPTAIGLSYDNNIWVYDAYDNKLKKIDEQGNLLLETPDFRSAFSETIMPQKILNDNGFVYLADSAKGIYVFDNYGSFKKKIPLSRWQHIGVKGAYVFKTTPAGLMVYNMNTFISMDKTFPSHFQPYIHAFSATGKLLNIGNNSVSIYSFRY